MGLSGVEIEVRISWGILWKCLRVMGCQKREKREEN